MIVYLLNICLILTAARFLLFHPKMKENKMLFCIICSISWILVSGLRGWGVGADTYAYYLSFQSSADISWRTAISQFIGNFFRPSDSFISYMTSFLVKDPGYLIFEKICYRLCRGDYQLYLIIVAIVFFASLGYFIYKNSENPCFSFILFSTSFYSFFAVTGIRQTLATALVVLIGNKYIQERKLIPFTLLFLIAFTLHKSAIVFFPFYFIATRPVTKKYIVVLTIALLFMLGGGGQLILYFARLAGYVKENNFVLIPVIYILLMSIIGISIAIFHKPMQKLAPLKSIEIHATLLATVFSVLCILDQGIMRVQQYFALYLMLSIPSFLKCQSINFRKLAYAGGAGLLILFLVFHQPYYAFCWQKLVLPDAYRYIYLPN